MRLRRDVPLLERLDSPAATPPGPPATVALMGPNISWLPDAPLLSPDQPIFLMTPAAQAVSGFFVWAALVLTCHQVNPNPVFPVSDTDTHTETSVTHVSCC